MVEAQRLLHSTASVAEIAHQIGFSESTNFVRFFRRGLSVTPPAFRQTALPASHSGQTIQTNDSRQLMFPRQNRTVL
jgi:AraC-like DNA-binding protein